MPHRVRSSPPCHFRVRGSATGAPAECRKTMARWKAGRLALVAAQPPHQNGEEDRWVRLIAPSINSYCTALDYKYANVLCVIFSTGPRTLCNACGLVYAKLVRLFTSVPRVTIIKHHACCVLTDQEAYTRARAYPYRWTAQAWWYASTGRVLEWRRRQRR